MSIVHQDLRPLGLGGDDAKPLNVTCNEFALPQVEAIGARTRRPRDVRQHEGR